MTQADESPRSDSLDKSILYCRKCPAHFIWAGADYAGLEAWKQEHRHEDSFPLPDSASPFHDSTARGPHPSLAEHEHDWQVSPLLAYMATRYDGPNYQYIHLQICSGCGLIRAPRAYAGYETVDDARAAADRAEFEEQAAMR